MSSDLMSGVLECVENMIEIDRHAVVCELANQLVLDESFTGGAGKEFAGVAVAAEEIDAATWKAAVEAASVAVDVTNLDESKDLALRLIHALAESATKKKATPAA